MDEMRILLENIDIPEQYLIGNYEKKGGYQTIRKAFKEIQPEVLVQMVKDSGLRGRGGAGFLTGIKWGFLPKEINPKYLVCNADESEPGTFKDRLLIEKDPHQLIEGMILTSYALNVHLAFIYCRGEYFEGNKRLNEAIVEAKNRGYLGENILNSGFSLNIIVQPGAGAYIAGEETAQLNSLEGYRATPRLKPPFPAVSGLYGKPTIVNNVETLCNVVHIVNRGVDWYRSIGTEKSKGTKIYQVSGQVQKPGCYEFPLGVPLKDILEKAGGMLPGRKFKACFPGGSSCSLLLPKDLDVPMDFESLVLKRTALGTASLIVMDDTADMVKVANRLSQFYQNESCGKCTPCREGTRWATQILTRIENGLGTDFDLDQLSKICSQMEENSFCPLAPGGALPLVSCMHEFKEEFEAYIEKNPNRHEKPDMKISYPYIYVTL
ncbi:MAG TPA: NADH-quinone oxidoreductase subunit NuoF [Parachlamydiaceae bacterium]|nr:NADH-quinone oxidoreductase subunit NuoF [Parachlamydiaceae bacterium]